MTTETYAATSVEDQAGNYTPITFTNLANGGTGFMPWQFSIGANASLDLTSSATNSGDINSTNDLSFRFYGGTNFTYAEATRDFNAPLSVDDEFRVRIAYNFNGGARGLNILNTSGAELLNINYGGADTLSLQFAGSAGVVVRTDYVSTAVVEVVVRQLPGLQLDVTLTRNDGYSTNLVSSGLSSAAAKVKFYNGGHEGNNANFALFVNDLLITPSSINFLALDGHDAMAAGMVNTITLSRSGTLDPVTVTLVSSDPAAATVPASIEFAGGDSITNFTIMGVGLGPVTVTASAAGHSNATFNVQVYDLGYDDSSYYPPGLFEDVGDGGLGFQPWIIQVNNSNGDGYTNYAGTFFGNSTTGGSDVNVQGSAFGLYANGEGSGGNPFANAVRLFDQELMIGQAVSLEIGVNFRNGSKGVALQNGGSPAFEVGVYSDDYFYKIGNETPVSLGWAYASDSAIEVLLKHVSADWYDITISRRGGSPETNALGLVSLPTTPNEARFFIFGTEPGDQNNLYFNRLALFSAEEVPALTISGNDGMVAGQTNLFMVSRSGPTNSSLSVGLASLDPGVALTQTSVVIQAGDTSASFEVTGVTNGSTHITADAPGLIGYSFPLVIVDIAYDDTTYYPPSGFTNGGNGGFGFQSWLLSDNSSEGDGYTNVAGFFTGSSLDGGSAIDSSYGYSFGIFATGSGTNGPDPLAEAVRLFDELEIGESVSVEIGVNFRNGAKGLMFQSGGTWLFEVAVFGDDYWYNIHDAGDNPVSLAWSYAEDSAIRVVLSRIGTTTYNVHLERAGSAENELLIQGITLSQAPDRIRFYVFDTDNEDPQNNLYVNRISVFTGIEGVDATDGIPNSWWNQYNVEQIDRVASIDLDGDGELNWDEYIADSNPDDINSLFTNRITGLSGSHVLNLQTGPTTNSRVYDIWWSTNLLNNPQEWIRLGVTTTGSGGTLSLSVTNDAPYRIYRTGVTLP